MAFGTCTGTDLLADPDGWATVEGDFTATTGLLTTSGGGVDDWGAGWYGSIAVDPTFDWSISATLTAHEGSFQNLEWHLGLALSDQDYGYFENYLNMLGDLYVQTDADYGFQATAEFDLALPIDTTLVWDAATQTLTGTLDNGDISATASVTVVWPDDFRSAGPYYPFFLSNHDTGFDVTYFCLSTGEGEGGATVGFNQVIFIGVP